MAQTFDCSGHDTNGEQYASISSMWQAELPVSSTLPDWYTKSEEYWTRQAPSMPGMLGGLDDLHTRDVNASEKFIRSPRVLQATGRALDVGAGIGRVTKHLLLPIFDHVDMLEQNEDYVKKSHSFVGEGREGGGSVGRRFVCGMQEFQADGFQARDGLSWGSLRGTYDLIWVQWCVIYLTDEHFVHFFQQCAMCLSENGVVCVKDNVARNGFLVDKEDCSVMRCSKYMKALFARAGLKVVKETRQVDFPRHVFPVRTYALRKAEEEAASVEHVGDVEGASEQHEKEDDVNR